MDNEIETTQAVDMLVVVQRRTRVAPPPSSSRT